MQLGMIGLGRMGANDSKAMNMTGEWQEQPADPCVVVIFGAAGDLTKRKLIPALYNLACSNLLPKEFAIIGFARALWITMQQAPGDPRRLCSC